MRKRLLSLFCAANLLLTLLPTSVFAVEDGAGEGALQDRDPVVEEAAQKETAPTEAALVSLTADELEDPYGDLSGDDLLMGYLYKRYLQSLGQQCCVRNAHEKAGHIASLHGPGTGADTHGGNGPSVQMGKQPARKLRQAFRMCKNGIGLAQPQRPLLYRKQLSAILPPLAIQKGDGGGVIAGINTNHAHVSFPLCSRSDSGQTHPEYRW